MGKIKTNIKKLFATPKRAVTSVICIIVGIFVLSLVTVSASTSIARSNSIGSDVAANYAFADAGVDPKSANYLTVEFDRQQGEFVYDVEFTADGMEYDYLILASNGAVIKKETSKSDDYLEAAAVTAEEETTTAAVEKETKAAEETTKEAETETTVKEEATTSAKKETTASAKQETTTSAKKETSASAEKETTTKSTTSSGTISLSKAKKIALNDAGLSSSDVTFTKTKLDYDDGVQEYDIEFVTSTKEYEYEINATTGKITSKDVENIKSSGNSNSSGSSGSDSSSTGDNYIGLSKAKSIATSHAGVSNVNYTKAKLERDDGKYVYEVEFYKDGVEYEYTIDAVKGTILDWDIDEDDD